MKPPVLAAAANSYRSPSCLVRCGGARAWYSLVAARRLACCRSCADCHLCNPAPGVVPVCQELPRGGMPCRAGNVSGRTHPSSCLGRIHLPDPAESRPPTHLNRNRDNQIAGARPGRARGHPSPGISQRLVAADRLQGNLGLEGRRMISTGSFHGHCSFVGRIEQ